MDFPRPFGKQVRLPSSASATSRKNKLQRCSVCGGLGHKSRTCDQTLKMGVAQDLSDCLTGDGGHTHDHEDHDHVTDPSAVRAAYGLLNLSSQAKGALDLTNILSPRSAPPVMAPPLAPPPSLVAPQSLVAPPSFLVPPPSLLAPVFNPQRSPPMHRPTMHTHSPHRWAPYAPHPSRLLMT